MYKNFVNFNTFASSFKIVIKTHVSNLRHFQDEIAHLFFLQEEALGSETFNILERIIYSRNNLYIIKLYI